MRGKLFPGWLAAWLLVALVAALPAAAAPSYHSPGYTGTSRAPATLPPPAPTPIQLGTGQSPQTIVDQAGTAHIVWNDPRGNDADAVHYCRLKRAATACDVEKDLVPVGDHPNSDYGLYNSEVGTPRVFALGDQVAIITNRYPNPDTGPDGVEHASNTYLFVSSDGGDTFSDGVLVGNTQDTGTPTVFGPSGSPRIGLISEIQTDGALFQEITGGRYESRQTNLGEGVQDSLAPVGDSVIAAIGDLKSQINLRQWNGTGDIYDPANWSQNQLTGDEPRLAGGPGGTFLISRPPAGASDESYDVRPVANGGAPGKPVKLAGTSNANRDDLFEDPSGKLYATYRQANAKGNDEFIVQTAGGAGAFSKPRVLRTVPKGLGVAGTDLAAAADGGGVAVEQESDSSAPGTILAAPFGNQQPTGQLGLGNELPGAPPDPSVVDTCSRLEFGGVQVVTTEGCLLSTADKRGVKVSEGTIRLNGIEIVPEGNTKVLLDPHAKTINSTGTVRVQLRAPGIPDIVLFHGPIHISLADEAKDQKQAKAAAFEDDNCSGRRLSDFSGNAELLGFPIKGGIGAFLEPGGKACIPVSLELPPAFGGIRGSAILRADNDHGLVISSLHIGVDQAFVGPVVIKNLAIDYEASNDEWRGMGLIGVPPQPGGLSVMGSVKFQGGDFKEGSILVSPPYPGIPLGPWPAYLSGIGGGFGVDPLFIEADVNIGIFQVPPSYIFGIKGQFRITFGDPVTFEAHGQGSVYDFDIADVNFLLNTDGFIRLNGGLSIDLKVVSVSAGVDIFVDVPNGAFSAEAKGHLCIVGLCDDDSAVVLSSKGFGLCISLPLQPDHGAGYVWGDSAPDIDLLSCDLAKYEVPLPPGHRLHAAQAGPQTFAVAAGTKVEDLRLTGADGKAPHVSLVSPSGERIVPTTDQTAQNPRALAAYPADSNRSFVGIQSPDAGTWQVVPDDGYAITEVATTHDVPAPDVAGSVGGKGRKRLLSYRTTTGDGLATTFYEKGAMGMHELGTAKGTRGTIKFAPGDGKAGKRTIVAVVERDGVPRLQKTIGSYSAPGPQKPARVKRLKVTRRGHKLTATWRKAAGATMYGVRFDLPDGRRLLRITSGTKAALTDAPKRGRVTVTVTARNKGGRKGPSARARR